MRKPYRITEENKLEAYKILKEQKNAIDTKAYRRVQAIALKGEGKSNAEISKTTGIAYTHVSRILGLFVREGFEALLVDNRKGGNNQKVTFAQELFFLESYREAAESGRIITVKDLWLDFQEEFNVSMARSSFYQLLQRHDWRKIIPRKSHPKKADDATIEASKKLTQNSKS